MSASIDSDSESAREAVSKVPRWFADWERRLSRFQSDSELSELNQQGGGWQRISDVLFSHIERAIQAAEYSGGLFDPTMLAPLEWLGYDRSFDLIEPATDWGQSSQPMPAWGWQLLEIDRASKRVLLPLGLQIDLSGLSKGIAAEQASRRLARIAPALVDAGGDIAVSGPRRTGDPWPIGLASPLESERDLGWLWLDMGMVATSGRDFRRWQVGEEIRHHLIDPRNGLPAQTDVIAATVLAPHGWQAEVGAKAALILGSAEGLSWLEEKSDLEGILVQENGNIVSTGGAAKYGW